MKAQWKVLARFRQLIELSDEEAEEILPLCIVNLEKVLSQVKEDSTESDIRIIEAAAALTYYDYSIKISNQTDNITSFKAGDITVSQTATSLTENAEKMKKEAFLELTPLMRDTSFIFMNV